MEAFFDVLKQQSINVSVTVGKCSGACQAWIDINDISERITETDNVFGLLLLSVITPVTHRHIFT